MEPTPANFQIPQRNPQYQGPVPIPTDLVNSYLNRQQQELQSIPAGLRQGINDYLDYQNKQKALQIEAFGQGGPYLMNLINGNRTNPNTPNPNQNPGIQPSSGNVGIPPVAGTPGGATMGNNGQPAQTSAQTLSPNPSPAYANGTPPASQGTSPGTGGVGGESPNAAQGWQPGQPMMHPTSGLPQTIHDHMQSQGIGGQDAQAQYLASLGLQPNQAGQLASMGQFGGRALQGLQTIGNLALQPGQQQLQQQGIQKGQFEQSQQPVIAAKNQQELINAQQAIPQKQKEVVASEVSKQGQDTQQIRNLQTLAGNLQKSIGQNLGLGANIKGNLYQATGGRIGSAAAANMQNSTIPLATGLNTVLSHRFNAGEVAALGESLIPQPKDTPQYQAQKLQNLNNLLNVMASGNEENVRNVASAITSGAIPKVGTGTSQSQSQSSQAVTVKNKSDYDALPNGTPFVWNGQQHIKGQY